MALFSKISSFFFGILLDSHDYLCLIIKLRELPGRLVYIDSVNCKRYGSIPRMPHGAGAGHRRGPCQAYRRAHSHHSRLPRTDGDEALDVWNR